MKPTPAQIKAVRKVLYDRTQLKQMANDIQQVNLLMNISGPPLPQNDVRIAVGDGPQWFIQTTGAVDPNILSAVASCQSLAKRLLSLRSAVARLQLPPADKQFLTTALNEQALTWSARATLWQQQGAPADPAGAVAQIAAHQAASFAALKHVQAYLRPPSDFNLGS